MLIFHFLRCQDTLSNLNQIVIEYDTTSFDTVEMYALITPKFLNINNATSELDSLYSNMDTLNNSSTELVNGSKELKNGLDGNMIKD